jgi:hypothetical protein
MGFALSSFLMARRSMVAEQFLDLGVVPNTLMPTILICHRLA